MTGSFVPVRCALCGMEITPSEGGRCHDCGRIGCHSHLRLTPKPDRTPYCTDCAERHGATIPAGRLLGRAQLTLRHFLTGQRKG